MFDRAIVIGCPGAGKSTFARKLRDRTGLPLYYLDRLFHRPDRSTLSREAFDRALGELLVREKWILDGNYMRTLPLRLRSWLKSTPTEAVLVVMRKVEVSSRMVVRKSFSSMGWYSSVSKS